MYNYLRLHTARLKRELFLSSFPEPLNVCAVYLPLLVLSDYKQQTFD